MKARQRELLEALQAASDNPIAQLALVYVYANRLRCSEKDVKAVQEAIAGGPVRDCRG